MGVPAFFAWLQKKYPSIVVCADKEFDHGYDFDNFYLDMNGIIHPCTHPENKPAPETEEEMFDAIFEYIDMLLNMVKPTKTLYMAIDGVAPRAKMNQQRSRRFRATKEAFEKKQSLEQIKDELRLKGVEFDETVKKAHFDTNVITPGTPFMSNLGKALRDWIDHKMANAADTYCMDNSKELRWPKDLVVILSDASVPGEGEHKIIDFVRKQKAQPDYNPNIKHCLCGADADLIMLGLATHELDFTILREQFIQNQPKPCEICSQYGHETKACKGKANIPDANLIKDMSQPFIYIRLCVLREYLEKECDDLDFERYIDDFILLCFFVGNDFLPHLPSLEIREGAIDKLLRIYKQCMSKYSHPKPYITNNGLVSLHKVQIILNEFGKMEDEIFVRRKVNAERYKSRLKKQEMLDHKAMNAQWLAPVPVVKKGDEPERLENVKQEALTLLKESKLKTEETSPESKQVKRKLDEDDESEPIDRFQELFSDEDELDADDDVQLWNAGWKERYYLHKFDCKNYVKVSDIVAREYVVGLCWVMRYYYQGCVDWQWYYPFHYAPFASDFKNVEHVKVEFNRDAKPFKPFEQLMSVFPAASSESLPKTWQELMKSPDSNIIDFYPDDFRIDLNGKKFAWQGVALLPFIDENRLFNTLEKVYSDLTPSEIDRNQMGENLIFISKLNKETSNTLTKLIQEGGSDKFDCCKEQMQGIKGKLRKSERYTDENVNSICLEYFDPEYKKDHIFLARKLRNAILPERVLKPEDFNNKQQYRGYQGNQGHQGKQGYRNNNHQNHQNNQPYRPIIGFQRRNDQATVGTPGRRMIDFYTRSNFTNNDNFNNNNNFQPTNQSNYQPSNYQTNQQSSNSQQIHNYQSNQSSYYTQNYRPNYHANQMQQQQTSNPYQLNYPISSQQQNQAVYSRRDNLNPVAQEFIPSYNQTPANQPQSSRYNQQQQSNYNRNNNNNRYRR